MGRVIVESRIRRFLGFWMRCRITPGLHSLDVSIPTVYLSGLPDAPSQLAHALLGAYQTSQRMSGGYFAECGDDCGDGELEDVTRCCGGLLRFELVDNSELVRDPGGEEEENYQAFTTAKATQITGTVWQRTRTPWEAESTKTMWTGLFRIRLS